MSFIIKSMPFSFGIGMHDVKYMYINKRSKIKYEQTATTKNDGKDKPALCRRKESWCVCVCVCVCVWVIQSCPTLWDPMDCSPPGSYIHGIFQQEYWSGLPAWGDFPNTGIKPESPTLQADSTVWVTREAR